MKNALKKIGIIYLAVCTISYIIHVLALLTDSESFNKYLEFSMTYTTNVYKRIHNAAEKVVSFFYN